MRARAICALTTHGEDPMAVATKISAKLSACFQLLMFRVV